MANTATVSPRPSLIKVKNFSFKPLQQRVQKLVGRSAKGNILVRFRHSGVSRVRFLPTLDWSQKFVNVQFFLIGLNSLALQRSAFVGTRFYPSYLLFSNVLLSMKDRVGKKELGYKPLTLSHFGLGSFVFNVSHLTAGRRVYARSAGAKCSLLRSLFIRKKPFVGLVLPSGERKYFPATCGANLGAVSNSFSYLKSLDCAGSAFRLGRRPRVRGVAMNPVDHPHGGGEGKSSGGRSSVSIWGWLTKGQASIRAFKWYKKKRTRGIRFF